MKYFGYDLETTGVDVTKDKPVQISLVHSGDDGYFRILYNGLCNPCMPISQEAGGVHGIKEESIKDKPDYAVALFNVSLLVSAFKSDEVLVTMNGKSFDLPMTENCLGSDPFSGLRHFDVYQAACRYFPDMKMRKLGSLYKYFFNEELSGAHDALADTAASIKIATAMSKKTLMTIDEMVKDLNEPKPYSVMPFGKYAGMTPDEVPKSWASWMRKNSGTMSPDLEATVNYVLDR